MKLKTILMQNFGVTNKEHYGMLWYFLEWSIKLPGAYLFQTHLRGSLIELGDLFNLARTMVLVVHKELRSWRSCSRQSKPNPNFQLVNKPFRISPLEGLQSWLNLYTPKFIREGLYGEEEGEGGIKDRGGLINFLPLRRRGLSRGFML